MSSETIACPRLTICGGHENASFGYRAVGIEVTPAAALQNPLPHPPPLPFPASHRAWRGRCAVQDTRCLRGDAFGSRASSLLHTVLTVTMRHSWNCAMVGGSSSSALLPSASPLTGARFASWPEGSPCHILTGIPLPPNKSLTPLRDLVPSSWRTRADTHHIVKRVKIPQKCTPRPCRTAYAFGREKEETPDCTVCI